MPGSVRLVVERHARKAAAVFSGISGMMAVALLQGDPRTGVTEPIQYLYATIPFAFALATGGLVLWTAQGKYLRWTIIEMAAFLFAGGIAAIVLPRVL